MNAGEVIEQLRTLPSAELTKIRDWLNEHEDESAELLEAIDAGLRSLEQKGAKVVTREQLEAKVRGWAGGSR